jgi:hypothetical protein
MRLTPLVVERRRAAMLTDGKLGRGTSGYERNPNFAVA